MVTPRFFPERGGIESHVFETARRLARDPDLEVEVLTTDLVGALAPRAAVEGVSVTRVRARGGELHFAPAIYRRVVTSQADVIHCQGYHTLVAPIAMLAARRARAPYVVTLHSGGHSSRLRRSLRPIQVRMLRPLFAGAERLIAVSTFEAELFSHALRLPPNRMLTIPNGADMPVDGPSARVDPDPNLILSVGRLERYKGHHRLIEALPAVRAQHPDVRLRIVGSGPYEARLRELADRHGIADAVEIRGVPRDEVESLLARASVVALLSEYESQGIAVHEALALGRRVVVLQATALAELTELPAVVAVSPTAAPAAVARALIEQLEAPELTAIELPGLPTWDDCAAQLREVYASVARKRT